MRRTRLVPAAALVACLTLPGAAHAAAPANDAPAGAIAFSPQTAENGTPTEKQGVADLGAATADAGVPRCLGASSFERTVWYRVPATSTVRTIQVSGTGGTGQSAAQPDLAAFVVGAGSSAPVEPQSCDGGEVEPAVFGGDDGGAPEVDVRVPAGQDVLVQVGRPAGQAAERVVLSEAERTEPAAPAPAGDVAGADTPTLSLGTTTTAVLTGATVTAEDPAEPACPASATVWRRFTAAESGTQSVRVAGDAVTAVTAFVGERPTADDAVSCTQRPGPGVIALDVPAQRGEQVWVRLGTETSANGATADLTVGGPGSAGSGTSPGATGPGAPGTTLGAGTLPKLTVALVDHRRKVTLRATGGSLRGVTVSFQRRKGSTYRTVASATLSSLTAGKPRTLTLRRKGLVRVSGRYRFILHAQTQTSPATRVNATRTRLLGRL